MRRFTLPMMMCAALCCAHTVSAQDDDKPKDAEGCKDSPLINRFPGSIISSCDNKEYEQADLPMPNDVQKHVEGDYHYWDYATRENTSAIQIFRNVENALKAAGFKIDLSRSPETLVGHKGKTWIYIESRGTYYNQTIVTEKAMQQEMAVDASSLNNDITSSGHVAVYGIHFDTGKATIQPDSESVLGEIVKMLQDNADLKLRIEGHTDNQGNASTNQALSDRRAQAVVAYLVAHGIDASRLSAKGMGQSQPVADNSTDDGRAKNRRVELVKQ
jgi:outer membrane protein OmpA-like peptidoglycan-associated protein